MSGHNVVEIELPGRGELILENISSVGEDDFIFSGSGGGTPDPDPDPDPGPGTPVVGDPQPNRLHGGPGNDDLDGGDGDDVLYGARGNDVLKGGAGVDSYEGGPGNDVIMVDFFDFTDGKTPDAGAEYATRTMAQGVFDGGENDDGTKDSDTLSFADFDDEDADGDGNGVTVAMANGGGSITYSGTTTVTSFFKNIENLIGSPVIDNLTGDDGDNIIEGGDGRDILDGGAGNDTASYRSSDGKVEVTVNGTANFGHGDGETLLRFENLIGSAYDDTLTGNDNPNVIEGLAGADTLDGGGAADADTLSYASSNAGVTIDLREGTGNNSNFIRTSSGGHATGDKITLGSFVNIIGSAHVDNLTGDNAVNRLEGGAGNDKLNGGEGDDTLDGGPGGDALDGGDGDMDKVTYENATGAVTIDLSGSTGRGTAGDARGDTYKNIELYVGSAHDDTFIAGPEADNADGGAGTDTISYERSKKPVLLDLPTAGATNSTPQVGGAHANVTDTNGNLRKENYAEGDILNNFDNIIGSNISTSTARVTDGTDMIHDKLTGNGEANVIDGRGGNDKISGGGGDDTLIGGSGDDILTGDGDADTFVISGKDTITDFTQTEDKLDFGGGSRSVLNLNYKVNAEDNNKLVINSGSHQVTFDTITGITGINGLDATNFIFNPDGYVKLTDNSPTGTDTRGNTTIHGGEGDNRLTGGGNDDIINGNGGDDTIDGGNGDDDIDGGSGDDIIEGDAGADELDGGLGTDTLSYAGSPSGPTTGNDLNPRTGVTITLNSDPTSTNNTRTHAEGDNGITGFENLTGSRYNDMLTGDSSANVIKGGSGNDVIDGNGGADELEGGAGRDRLITTDNTAFLSYAGSGSSVNVDLNSTSNVTLNDADAALFGVATVNDVIKVSGGDASGDIATGFVNVIGGRGGDTLIGDGGNNELRGLGGSDTLTGNGGNDTLKGGAGNDRLQGGVGDDRLDGGPGGDTLEGGGDTNTPGTDTATYESATAGVTVDLNGGSRARGDAAGDTYIGIEQYEGSGHDDVFIAGDGEDALDGGAGTDTLSYAGSPRGSTTGVNANPRTGVTVALNTNPTDTENTGTHAEGDTFINGGNFENLTGSNYDDRLTAGSTGSVITGGQGDDDLNAGGGNDTFVFAPRDGEDTVTGFDVDNDKIDLSAFTSIASMDDLEGEITLLVNGTDTDIDLPNSGEITLRGVLPTALTPDNFIFYTKSISGNIGDKFNNEINGGRGDDAIYGEQGRDILNGGEGDDEIYGGEDRDTINGGEGNDLLDGGPDADTFVFEPGNGNDYIMDYTVGTDNIQFKGFTNAAGNAITNFTATADGDGNYVIDLTTAVDGGMITLLGVTADPSSDFSFVA